MTDINLKTLTPDTSLPKDGFIFGADSQASTNPSVYTTQSVATTLLGSTSLTGDTLTADAPVLNLTQAWNSVGTTFTGMRFNAAGSSDTNSAYASLLMDLQVGGVSKISFNKFGGCTVQGSSFPQWDFSGNSTVKGGVFSALSSFDIGSGAAMRVVGAGLCTTGFVGWNLSNATLAADTLLTRRGTANLRFGAADAASPVAQTLSVQSVVAGTAGNVAGQDFKITGSQGVGSGAGGSLIFQVAPAGSTATFTVTFTNGSATINGTGLPTTAGTAVAFTTTGALPTNFAINTTYFVLAGSTSTAITVAATAGGTAIVAGSAGSGTQTLTRAVAQNALADALTIASDKSVTFAGTTINLANSTNINAKSLVFTQSNTAAIFYNFGISYQSGGNNGVNIGYSNSEYRLSLASTMPLVWTSAGSGDGGAADLSFTRVGAGIIKIASTTAGTGVGVLVTNPTIVASLPAAATAGAGARAFVTDSNQSMTVGNGLAVATGGTEKVPVYSDGSIWLIG